MSRPWRERKDDYPDMRNEGTLEIATFIKVMGRTTRPDIEEATGYASTRIERITEQLEFGGFVERDRSTRPHLWVWNEDHTSAAPDHHSQNELLAAVNSPQIIINIWGALKR